MIYFRFKNPNKIINQIGILLFLLIVSYFTYVHNYEQPAALFWDENYHIATAQKYLNNIFFMEPHPPLGKILIALGEATIHGNITNNQFLDTDYGKNLPEGFSLLGYRFFPVILAWLNTPVLFLICFQLTKNNFYSLIFTCFYIFDNALIVHSRGAMLDSTLLFFICLNMLLFLLLPTWINKSILFIYGSIGLGITLGLAVTTKSTGLFLIVLLPFLIWQILPQWRKILILITLSTFGFLLTFILVWQIHFSLTTDINPQLNNKGYYQASETYQQILAKKKTNSLWAFPVMIQDSIKFSFDYQKNVPKLNLCKKDENGSPFFFWLVGARSINYRWETPDGKSYKYLYLQVNPVIWLIGLFGVILATSLRLTSWLLPLKKPLENGFLLTTFLALYWGYILAISKIDRVMYLYHYFPPLLISFCLFTLVFQEIKQIGIFKLTTQIKNLILGLVLVAILTNYRFYAPLTYYQPLTDEQFKQRMIFPLWNLKCVKCDDSNPIFKPIDNK